MTLYGDVERKNWGIIDVRHGMLMCCIGHISVYFMYTLPSHIQYIEKCICPNQKKFSPNEKKFLQNVFVHFEKYIFLNWKMKSMAWWCDASGILVCITLSSHTISTLFSILFVRQSENFHQVVKISVLIFFVSSDTS